MSSVPAEIAGIGSTAQKLRTSPGFDPLAAKIGPDEYFVLSRIDGSQSLREVLLATGLPVERAIAIVIRLRSLGALLLPGEAAGAAGASRAAAGTGPRPTEPARAAAATVRAATGGTPGRPTATPGRTSTGEVSRPTAVAAPRTVTPAPSSGAAVAAPRTVTPAPSGGAAVAAPRTVTPASSGGAALRRAAPPVDASAQARAAEPPVDIDIRLPDPTAEELIALAEPCDLADTERRRILAMARLAAGRDLFALLGVPPGTGPKQLKRAYFRLSKVIHPDRFYGRELGTFGDRLSGVFEAVSRAYERLSNPERAKLSGGHQAVTSEQPQTPQEYAAELFERACAVEIGGDALGAMKLFAAAVRIDPQTRFMRRAASCALAAGQPKTALEYAKKAQVQASDDASVARLLAAAFRAAGKLGDAEEVLVMAMALKTGNDVLHNELRNDLAEVRRQLAEGG